MLKYFISFSCESQLAQFQRINQVRVWWSFLLNYEFLLPLQNFPYSVFKRRGKPESIQESLRNKSKCQILHQKITMIFSLYQGRITMNHEEKKEIRRKCFKGCVTFYLHSGYISFCFESKLPGAARPLQVLAFHLWIGKGLL